MSDYKHAGQALVDDFLRTVIEQVLEPLKYCHKKISWQAELKESKKFGELETKLADTVITVRLLNENLVAREKVVETLSAIKANRMMQFLDDKDEIKKAEDETLTAVLEPYTRLIAQLEECRLIEYNLLNKARLMKLPLALAEISAGLTQMQPVISDLNARLRNAVAKVKDSIDV